jgi:methylase of polypeptide subunit release factors
MSDIEDSAIKNIKKNVKNFNLEEKIKIIKSDLFTQIGRSKFDIVIFNHPFFPGKSFDAISRVILSGPTLLEKFFKNVNSYQNGNGLIIMPFSHLAPFHNDPINFIDKYGYHYIDVEMYNKYGRHSIYIMSKKKQTIEYVQNRLKVAQKV